MTKIILASSSKYRQALLKRIIPEFKIASPDIDESVHHNETPKELVKRLSIAKATKVGNEKPDSWVIGSDQVATFDNKIVGKPGNREAAFIQLSEFSGKKVCFYTGLSLINIGLGCEFYDLDITEVEFNQLTNNEIEQYIALDAPLDCAGSFKVESRGPCLFSNVFSSDPTGLQGLPLIKLNGLFKAAGINLLSL